MSRTPRQFPGAILARVWAIICLASVVPAARADRLATETQPAPRLANDRCPVMTDEFASPLHEVQYHGMDVRFCCNKCERRFTKDPLPYLSRLPQFSPARVGQIVAAAYGDDARAARIEGRIERWTQPLLLAAATLIAGWLAMRVVRRTTGRA